MPFLIGGSEILQATFPTPEVYEFKAFPLEMSDSGNDLCAKGYPLHLGRVFSDEIANNRFKVSH